MASLLTLIRAAQAIAAECGTQNLTRAEVCKRAGVAEGSFNSIAGERFSTFLKRIEGPRTIPGEGLRRQRLPTEMRHKQILDAALATAKRVGCYDMRAEDVALEASITRPLLYRHFKTAEELRQETMRHAVLCKDVEVIGQGLARKCPIAKSAPGALKKAAVAALI